MLSCGKKEGECQEEKMLNKRCGMPLGGGTHQYLCTMCLQCPERPGGTRSPGTGVTGGSEQLCGSWEFNLDSLKEQSVPLTTGLSLQA